MIDDVEIEKRNFQRIKYLSFLKHVDVDNILKISKKVIGTLLVTQMVILMMIMMIIKLNHFV